MNLILGLLFAVIWLVTGAFASQPESASSLDVSMEAEKMKQRNQPHEDSKDIELSAVQPDFRGNVKEDRESGVGDELDPANTDQEEMLGRMSNLLIDVQTYMSKKVVYNRLWRVTYRDQQKDLASEKK